MSKTFMCWSNLGLWKYLYYLKLEGLGFPNTEDEPYLQGNYNFFPDFSINYTDVVNI